MQIINSLVTLNQAINNQELEVELTDEDPLAFDKFFYNFRRFKSLKSLKILSKTNDRLKLSPIRDRLKFFIENGLKVLIIQAKKLEGGRDFLNQLENSYSPNLEKIEIVSQQYIGFENSRFELDQLKVDEISKRIIDINQEICEFLKRDFEKELRDLSIDDDTEVENMTKEQVKYLWEMGCRYNKIINKIDKLELSRKIKNFNNVKNTAYSWCLNIIISSDMVEKIIKLNEYELLDLNEKYFYNGIESFTGRKRIIDWAVTNKTSLDIVSWLILKKVNLTKDFDFKDFKAPTVSTNNSINYENFPLHHALNTRSIDLISLLLQESTVYDALAWYIFYDDEPSLRTIKNMFEDVEQLKSIGMKIFTPPKKHFSEMVPTHGTVNYNKLIPEGKFKGFTLFQLMILYSKTNLIFNSFSEFPQREIEVLSGKTYPHKKELIFSGWTTFEVIVYKGLANECEALVTKIDPKDFSLNNTLDLDIITLLLHGISEEYSLQNSEKAYQKKCSEYKRVISLLIKQEWIRSGDLTNIKFNSAIGKCSLPLLHFSIIYNCYNIFKDYISVAQETLALKYSFPEVYHINALQLFLFRFCKSEVTINRRELVDFLCQSYRQSNLLLETLRENFAIGNRKENILQYLLIKESKLFTVIAGWPESPINIPFLASHPFFSGYLPIHYALQKSFTKDFGGVAFSHLMKCDDIDLTRTFPYLNQYNLGGYYILGACFYLGNPTKNNSLSPKNLFPISIGVIDRIRDSNISERVRTEMFNQALVIAVMNYSASFHCHDEVRYLLKNGANPYQNVEGGRRVIDLAMKKGINDIFESFLNEPIKSTLTIGAPKLIANQRKSDFAPYTGGPPIYITDGLSVVSLVRNINSKISNHVFLVIERIDKGSVYIDFIDFVLDREHPGFGKVRHNPRHDNCYGHISEEKLIFRLERDDLMKIDEASELFVTSWQIPAGNCQQIMDSINHDKKDKLRYSAAGTGILAKSSGSGDNCYTWARKKLLASGDRDIKKYLKPTFEEYILCHPRYKMTNSTIRNSVATFFSRPAVVVPTIALAAAAGIGYYSLG